MWYYAFLRRALLRVHRFVLLWLFPPPTCVRLHVGSDTSGVDAYVVTAVLQAVDRTRLTSLVRLVVEDSSERVPSPTPSSSSTPPADAASKGDEASDETAPPAGDDDACPPSSPSSSASCADDGSDDGTLRMEVELADYEPVTLRGVMTMARYLGRLARIHPTDPLAGASIDASLERLSDFMVPWRRGERDANACLAFVSSLEERLAESGTGHLGDFDQETLDDVAHEACVRWLVECAPAGTCGVDLEEWPMVARWLNARRKA